MPPLIVIWAFSEAIRMDSAKSSAENEDGKQVPFSLLHYPSRFDKMMSSQRERMMANDGFE